MFAWLSPSDSHSLRGAAMLLSMEVALLAAVFALWLCAAWPVFWLWAGWFWPAWLWLWAGLCVWLGLLCGLEASMLLPMLLPSCSRLMCRTTAVALNACWREVGNEKMKELFCDDFIHWGFYFYPLVWGRHTINALFHKLEWDYMKSFLILCHWKDQKSHFSFHLALKLQTRICFLWTKKKHEGLQL